MSVKKGTGTRSHDSSKGLKLLSYGRVSDVRGREGPGFISPTEQLARSRSYCDAYGHKILEEGIDLDRSGGEMSRPVFDGFLDRIRSGEADGLIVAKLDRFARSNLGALQAIEEIENAGGVLISVQEQIDPRSASGRFMRSIFLATAQMERERIGEQWHVARSSAVKRGIHVAPHVPPGYVRSDRSADPETDRRLTPHKIHAETIREAFRMAAEGESYASIAAFLNERELPTISVKHGERSTLWLAHRVSRLLSNRVYLGEARSGDGIENVEAHEPLVDEATFVLAQARRGRRATKTTTTYLLSGLCRCASCSYAMRAQPARGATMATYRCATMSVHGRCPSPTAISMEKLEEFVLAKLVEEAEDLFRPSAVEDDGGWSELALVAAEAERSYRAQLGNMDLRRQIGDADHDELIAALHSDWRDKDAAAAAVRTSPKIVPLAPDGMSLRDYVDLLRTDGNNVDLRRLLEATIGAIFIRPAVSRSHNLPASDRVLVVFRGDRELDVPQRGRRFQPRVVAW